MIRLTEGLLNGQAGSLFAVPRIEQEAEEREGLVEERNLVTAARLLEVKSEGRTLVLVGRARVDGIRRLLSEPRAIQHGSRSNGLNYSPPTRLRRVRVN